MGQGRGSAPFAKRRGRASEARAGDAREGSADPFFLSRWESVNNPPSLMLKGEYKGFRSLAALGMTADV